MHEVVEEHRVGEGFRQVGFEAFFAVGPALHPQGGSGPARFAEFLDEPLEFEGVAQQHRVGGRSGDGDGMPVLVQGLVFEDDHDPKLPRPRLFLPC